MTSMALSTFFYCTILGLEPRTLHKLGSTLPLSCTLNSMLSTFIHYLYCGLNVAFSLLPVFIEA